METLIKAIDKNWVSIHGPMREFIIDGETALAKGWLPREYFKEKGITVIIKPPGSHAKFIERSGAITRDTLHKVYTQLEKNGITGIPFSQVLGEVTFSGNAPLTFNTVDRQTFLDECKQHFPELYAWAAWCYGEQTRLFCGNTHIPSECGVQQGDPLGPLLFALALQPVLRDLHGTRSAGGLQLVFSYLDDLCLAGEQAAVSQALAILTASAARIGLQLNAEKCEIIPTARQQHTINRSLFPPSFVFKGDGNFELLGGPIGSDEFCNEHTQNRVDKACKLLSALGELPDPQVALLLLRQCASFGKLVYSLRPVPPKAHARALQSFDQAVRECLDFFLCCSLGDIEWTTASLSTAHSGLGLRSTCKHSCAAFLASRFACHGLCAQLDPHHEWEISQPNSAAASALQAFNNNVDAGDQIALPVTEAPQQKSMSVALDKHTRKCLMHNLQGDPDHRAHLELTRAESAGQWLYALPSAALHNKVEPLLFKTMVQRWLRMPIFSEAFVCSEDIHGDHALTCCEGGDRTKRQTTFSATQSGTSVTARVSLLSWRNLVYCSLAHFRAFFLRMVFAGTTPKPGDLLTYIYRDLVRAVQSASTSQLLPECVAPT